ncbi:MAG: hypothetical protein ABSH14_02315 [Verrucomicrobiia bacterium]|jgi:hypothetical protein
MNEDTIGTTQPKRVEGIEDRWKCSETTWLIGEIVENTNIQQNRALFFIPFASVILEV